MVRMNWRSWRLLPALVGLGLLSSGLLAAYAAEPIAPGRLPSEVQGVVGSGDQLSLRLKDDRIIAIGQTYADGWTLTGLSPTKATLAKDGATLEVGLNPQGVVASAEPAGPASNVTVVGVPDEETLRRMYAEMGGSLATLDRLPARPGLTQAESRRLSAYSRIENQAIMRFRAANGGALPSIQQIADMLGGQAAFDDMTALNRRAIAATQAAAVADLAARPVTGATSFYVPAGANVGQVVSDQGIDGRGLWSPGPADAQGGRTFTLTAGTAEQYSAVLASGQPLPPPLPPPPPPGFTGNAIPPPSPPPAP